MNLVSGFISAKVFYLFTFLPLVVPCLGNQNTICPVPSPLHFCNHAAIIGFYKWKFLYFRDCGRRVKVKPQFQFAALCGGKVSQQILHP